MSLEQIKILREKTGAGLGACKEALAQNNNDVEAAVTYLRKKGLADMAKRAGRETKEGRISIKTSADGKTVAMAYLGCETDFVAKTPDFIALVDKIADYMLANPTVADYTKDETIKAMIHELAPKFGENVSFTKAICWTLGQDSCLMNYYLHSDNKKAALVELACKSNGACDGSKKEEMMKFAKDLSMQAVGMVAQYLDEADVPAEVVEKEKEIALTQAKNEGKPQAAIEKMIPGRIKKFYKDVCLLDQPYFKDSKISVRDLIAETGKKNGAELKVVRFVRF
ncbi:MAG: translation elongation factor Ts [Elusimicrobiaceae bacterium]|nr:translation elongation factor Ts [Elusimicrobiaceae bacterium]